MTYEHTTLAAINARLGRRFTLSIRSGVWRCNGATGATIYEAIGAALSISSR